MTPHPQQECLDVKLSFALIQSIQEALAFRGINIVSIEFGKAILDAETKRLHSRPTSVPAAPTTTSDIDTFGPFIVDHDKALAATIRNQTLDGINEELQAIEGYVNGIKSGDESPERMCYHILQSIGCIKSLRTQEHK